MTQDEAREAALEANDSPRVKNAQVFHSGDGPDRDYDVTVTWRNNSTQSYSTLDSLQEAL